MGLEKVGQGLYRRVGQDAGWLDGITPRDLQRPRDLRPLIRVRLTTLSNPEMFDYAVQPTSFGRKLDQWGCLWAKDIDHAYDLAMTFGEKATIWKCPHTGEPMAWMTVDQEAIGPVLPA